MTGLELLASIAAVAASAGAVARTTLRTRINRLGAPLLLAGWIGLVCAIAPTSVRDRWPVLVVGLLVALGVGWLLAGLLRGRERWILAAGGLVLTLRIPVPTGDGSAMLLGPLYVVIAIGALVLVRSQLRIRERRSADRGGATRLLDVGAAALPSLATLSLTWSFDRMASAEALAFFLVPFVLAYALVRSWASSGVDLRPATWALLLGGLVDGLVGIVQASRREVWWNPKVVDANRFRADVRTNSLFWDPNIYGRALVVAILLLVAWLLVSRLDRARALAALAFGAFLALALWHTYSQSSWVALAAGLAVLAVLTQPPRPRRWIAALLAVVVLVGLPYAARGLSGDDATGREDVVRTGIALGAEQPVGGWGIGTFEEAARARELEKGNRSPRLTASHTTPVTVFAELGVLGIFTYLTLLASAAVAVLARWRRSSTPAAAARARGEATDVTGWPAMSIIWATATLVALVAHSLLYANFFEDATLWVSLAVLASLPLVDESVVPVDARRTRGAAGTADDAPITARSS
jgi:O-antigen ligase